MKNFILPVLGYSHSIRVSVDGKGSGSVESSLKENSGDSDKWDAAIDAIESVILAHACAGIDIEDPKYIEGVDSALEALSNNLED